VSTTPITRSTQNCNCSLRYWSYFLCSYLPPKWPSLAWPRWREVAAVPEAVVTVLCTPDNGCGWHPKHLEWTCRIISRLLCVASRCKLIQISDARKHKHKDFFIWNILLFTHSPIFIVFLMSTLALYVMKPHFPQLQFLVLVVFFPLLVPFLLSVPSFCYKCPFVLTDIFTILTFSSRKLEVHVA